MLDRAVEENHLRQVRSHVVAATARIASQCLVISQLRAHGLDTRQAEACLQTMQHTLDIMRAYKALIEGMVDSGAIARLASNRSASRRMPF
jgi:hypothetical protein